jgi:putative restriction endonuclease
MVNIYVGITDYDWFRFLSALTGLDEVNFWQPGGRTNFQALRPGELFLFKLHAPRNFIVGGGVFARADILPISLAWEAFGVSNGAPSPNFRGFDLNNIDYQWLAGHSEF